MSFLFQSERALTIKSAAIPDWMGRAVLVPMKLAGQEGINELFEYRLILQTPDEMGHYSGMVGLDNALSTIGAGNLAQLLEAAIGHELTCFIELEGHGSFLPGLPGAAGLSNIGAGQREISGIITAARFIGEASRHVVCEITLRPWLYLATLTTDCKVFQNKTPAEVIRSVLSDYSYLTDVRLIENYPQRDYIVQYNETDFQFISRLMQAWGINYHFEHAGTHHRLILSDHNGAFHPSSSSAYHEISYYPPGHKIDEEYIHDFKPQAQLTSRSFETREFDYTRPSAILKAQQGEQHKAGESPRQDVYLWRGSQTLGSGSEAIQLAAADWSQPNAGTLNNANQTGPQGELLARLRHQAIEQHHRRATGLGHVRGIVPGGSFHLINHPQTSANVEYLTLSTQLLIENVSEDTQRSNKAGQGVGDSTTAGDTISKLLAGLGTALTALSDGQRLSGHWQATVKFTVQPATELLRPAATQPKPRLGSQTALVTAPEPEIANSNMITDELGRIKVRFYWDRYSKANQNSSCWVRVSQPWAGNQLGAIHLPRAGQEVLVVFLEDDIDRPVCVSGLYNQDNLPPWALAGQQALTGIRSRELKSQGGNSAAGRSNHLVLDDTDGQIQAQFKSDHDASQLSLGHVTRIEDNKGRKDYRGEGFELRTDGHGALRAKDGLIVSTEARSNASGHITDLSETATRLQKAQVQHQSLSSSAQELGAQDENDQAAVAQNLEAQNDEISGKAAAGATAPGADQGFTLNDEGKADPNQPKQQPFPELKKPHLVIASPAGIASTTSGSTHQHSGQHHAITSDGHTSIVTGKSLLAGIAGHWRAFVQQGIRFFAARGKIELRALGDDIDVEALKTSINLWAKLKITETSECIEITATKELVLNGGGSYIKLNADNIEGGSLGPFVVHAADQPLLDPRNLPVPVLPEAEPAKEIFVMNLTQHESGADAPSIALLPYKLYKDGALVKKDVTNELGQVVIEDHKDSTAQYKVELHNIGTYEAHISDQIAQEQQSNNEGLRDQNA